MTFTEQFPSLNIYLYEYFVNSIEREILEDNVLDKQIVREAIEDIRKKLSEEHTGIRLFSELLKERLDL